MNKELNLLCKMQKLEHPSCNSVRHIMVTNFQSPNLQRKIIRKFSPINLLIIFYQLTKFEAPSCYRFRDIIITLFSKSKSAKGDISKKNKTTLF